ncbi:MAG: 1,2-phenylacetyl-CoA epoxidase subunit B [Ignavibacteria bacterium]|nr:1,2-phenylacetyl-CoA epoxidase subunit B [Ignavibacteria bacterium]MBK6773972.1 1,2-phenylacetyl-CoA epoxidase subunit B [Ignavibacteria bacterium]MBK7160415.1 1,2-phenylacetyl-CoA epoxidase subunit B [Ignavibacteria bacterium]MBK7447661.1 1,2-phenylacetyl-CoA epoxidase subunit B [Ignavibacteria bacterium]MBK8382048.1 1,2-phenylacetyl-CoA epoxidase subunit B [Ignavibacteria bacterium]
MSIKSIDPRITREKLPEENDITPLKEIHHWQTYEVFHQAKTGDHHIHVGSLHAPNSEMALILAKEQYARRYSCINLWVVKTSDICRTTNDEEEIFGTTPDKIYREAGGYKVMDRINKFKQK